MVNSMVSRATSSMLIGPDWAMNIEICDICNQDPMQAKDVVKGIKKRLRRKNTKVRLLALTLLETMVKNCGDIVHMHVAEKGVLHEMVKIVKKKHDFHVKEKILVLIDTWQEAFGGPRARYPQYFAAYQELLRLGAVFPQRSEISAPGFTPPQTKLLSSYPQNPRNPDSRQDGAESSAEAEFPTLSLTEIQNARGIMDVLAEMLNELDPGNKEGLKQDVIVDLVEQCRTYRQRVVHLVNSTSDESLLSQGLALNDELQRVLAKHEAIASGNSVPAEQSKTEPARALVDVDAPLIDTKDSKTSDQGSSSGSAVGTQLLLPAPAANGPSSTKMDLLSGDDFSSPMAESSLALVPVGEPQPVSPVASQQNALALVDMFAQSNTQSTYSVGQTYPSSTQFQQQQNLQSPQPSLYPNGSVPGATLPQYEQSVYTQGSNNAWNGPIVQPRQSSSPVYGAEGNSSLPPPPWEAQPTADNSPSMASQPLQTMQAVGPPLPNGPYPHGSQHAMNDQGVGMYMQPVTGGHLAATNNQAVQGNQLVVMHPQQMPGGQSMGMYPQMMQSGQVAYMYPQQIYSNQMAGYGYGYSQQQNAQFLEQRMSGLSVGHDGATGNSSYPASNPSYVPSVKPSKPEDKLFGDLVDITKFKSAKTPPGRAANM